MVKPDQKTDQTFKFSFSKLARTGELTPNVSSKCCGVVSKATRSAWFKRLCSPFLMEANTQRQNTSWASQKITQDNNETAALGASCFLWLALGQNIKQRKCKVIGYWKMERQNREISGAIMRNFLKIYIICYSHSDDKLGFSLRQIVFDGQNWLF